MIRPALIDLNSVELKCYPFMISLNKHNGNWSCVPKEEEDINIESFKYDNEQERS